MLQSVPRSALLLLLFGALTLAAIMAISYAAAQRDGSRYHSDSGCAPVKAPDAAAESFCRQITLSVLQRNDGFQLTLGDEAGRIYSVTLVGGNAADVWSAASVPGRVSALLFVNAPALISTARGESETTVNPDWRRHQAYYRLILLFFSYVAIGSAGALVVILAPSPGRRSRKTNYLVTRLDRRPEQNAKGT